MTTGTAVLVMRIPVAILELLYQVATQMLTLLASTLIVATLAAPTNIIFLLVDELGWNNVAWNNNSVAPMPHTTQLYQQGMGLEQHYVQRWCTPTRAALLTGRYIHRTGIHTDTSRTV